jgi:hypothetical protein
VFLDQFSGRRLAPATAAADRQLHLYLAKAAGTLLNGAPNLAVSDPVAKTDVHESNALPALPATRGVPAKLDTNANDCQLPYGHFSQGVAPQRRYAN